MKKTAMALIMLLFLFATTKTMATSILPESNERNGDDMLISIQNGIKNKPLVECRMNITEQNQRLTIKASLAKSEGGEIIQTIILSKSGGKGTIVSYYNTERDPLHDTPGVYSIFENWCLGYIKDGIAPKEIKEFVDIFYENKPKAKVALPEIHNSDNLNKEPDTPPIFPSPEENFINPKWKRQLEI